MSADGPRVRLFFKRQSNAVLTGDSEGVVRVHIAALLTQVTDARFNARVGFSDSYLNGGNELVTRMNPAVCPGKRDGRASRLFRFTGDSGRARKLFRVTGNP